MNTRLPMTLSAVLLTALGITITFLPHELLTHVGAPAEGPVVLLMQLLGALYLGAALLNWMNRGLTIGGIYGRAVTMANLLNFAVGGLALVKGLAANGFAVEVTVFAAVYVAFAVWFGLMLFTQPGK